MPPKKSLTYNDETETNSDAPTKKKSRPEEVLDSQLHRSKSETITEESILSGTTPFQRITSDADFSPSNHIKFVSWNVAGLRAVLSKGTEIQSLLLEEAPDVLCLQETKLSDWEVCPTLGNVAGYSHFDSISVSKKGYSGTRTYLKNGVDGIHIPGFKNDPTEWMKKKTTINKKDDNTEQDQKKSHDVEGRVITTVLPSLHIAVVNSYVPNSGMTLDRLGHRVNEFDPLMRTYLQSISSSVGDVIWTGDLNVAERDYDRFFATNFKQMQKSPGFSDEERASFRTTLSKVGMVDSFRLIYPNSSKIYSFWSARFQQRVKNNGWRLDYFVVSAGLAKRVVDSYMLPKYVGSDHCPIALWLTRK